MLQEDLSEVAQERHSFQLGRDGHPPAAAFFGWVLTFADGRKEFRVGDCMLRHTAAYQSEELISRKRAWQWRNAEIKRLMKSL